MESTSLDFRSGLVVALPSDGCGRMVGVAESGMAKGADVLFYPACAKCCVDADLFWSTSARLGNGGNSLSVACYRPDDEGVFPNQQGVRLDARTLSGVGNLRSIPKLHTLADESRMSGLARLQ